MSLDLDNPSAPLALGFGAIFNPTQERLVEGISAFYERYSDRYREQLRWCLFTTPKRYQRIADKHRGTVRHALSKAPRKWFVYELHDGEDEDSRPRRFADAFCIGEPQDIPGWESWGSAQVFQSRLMIHKLSCETCWRLRGCWLSAMAWGASPLGTTIPIGWLPTACAANWQASSIGLATKPPA